MNGSYGYDIMNEELFTKAKILDKENTFVQQLNPNFVATKKLKDNQYQVQLVPRKFRCGTSLIQGFFTLDNAKYWYLNFIYNFMYKCLDMTRIHFIEGDTDSMYWAVAGDPNEGYDQGFKHVISNLQFYNENVYKFFPSDWPNAMPCNGSTPLMELSFTNDIDKQLFDKKLGGLAIEKQCESMIALAPKVYSCYTNNKPAVNKAKGVGKTVIKELTFNEYSNVLIDKAIKSGTTQNLQLMHHSSSSQHPPQHAMTKMLLTQNALTASHTKYKVSPDFSTCLPLFI
jgi:hypothetical protein